MRPSEQLRRIAAQSGFPTELIDALLDATAGARAEGSAVTIDRAAELLGCGRTKIFALLKDGTLQPAAKLGRQRMIRRSSVEACLSAT